MSQPDPEVVLVRMLADSSDELKRALARLRDQVSAHLPGLRQSARKL
jgi:hypothetical protein